MDTLKRIIVFTLLLPIRIYQIAISPWLGQNCRYHPNCSDYVREAIEVHGPLKGSYLGLRRLTRCHPVKWLGGGGGIDPVPENKKRRLS